MTTIPLEAPPQRKPTLHEAQERALELFITAGYKARRGTRPTFATPQQAEAFDFGYAAFEFGQDMPTDEAERSGWFAADRCYSRDREDRVEQLRGIE